LVDSEWNGRLVYGAGSGFDFGVQGPNRIGPFDLGRPSAAPSCAEAMLVAGYALALADATLGPAASDIVAAETLLRIRERFIKWYALPQATVGIGGGEAGPALARIAGAYPGLDAVGPGSDARLAEAARGCS
jgi:hypothetical protein